MMAVKVRITAMTRYVSLHRLARFKHSHNPLLSHPACHKSEQRRAKSYLGAWGGNIFSEWRAEAAAGRGEKGEQADAQSSLQWQQHGATIPRLDISATHYSRALPLLL